MSVTFPRTDIQTMVGWSVCEPMLNERQELAPRASGVVQGRSFSSALWSLSMTTEKLRTDAALDFEAVMRSLDGVINGFYLGDVRREYPRLLPTGVWVPTGYHNQKISNPGFESDLTGWSAGTGISVDGDARTGAKALVLDKGSDVGGTTREGIGTVSFDVVAASTYRFSAWVKGSLASAGGAHLRLSWRNAADVELSLATIQNFAYTTSYSQISGLFTAPAGASRARAIVRHSSTGSARYLRFDDLTLVPEYGSGFDGSNAQIHSLGGDGKSLKLKTIPQTVTLSRGDYLSFEYDSGKRAYHQVMESAVADTTGATNQFEVRPHIRSGAAVDAAVRLGRPQGLFVLVPGTLKTDKVEPGWYTVSFVAAQTGV